MQKKTLASGVIANVVVPFTSGGEIDLDLLRAEVNLLDESPIDGICIGGLLSGMAGASPQELNSLSQNVRRASKKQMFAMLFPDITEEAIEMARAVTDGGAEAILMAQPHYLCQPGESGVAEMFTEVRKFVSCPLLLSDCFPEAKVDIKTTMALINRGLIDGVLQAADVHALGDLLCLRPGIPVYSGFEDLHYVAFLLGAHGAISDLGAVFPEDLSGLYRSFRSGKHKDARLRHERLARLWRVLSPPAEREARIRVALNSQRRDVGVAPSPYGGLRAEATREISAVLSREGVAEMRP